MNRIFRLIGASVGAVAFLLSAGSAWSQASYPMRPIRLIVPWPPGGGADVLTRMLTPKLSEALGQQIIIDNRGGAAGNIGAEMAARAPADGYTIVFAYSGTHSINPHIYAKMPFREADFVPLIWLASVPQVIVVHPSLPVKTVKDLIAIDKAKPGQLSFGSSGNGAINHLAGELFNFMTGTKLVHVPYKGGGPAAIALISGEIGLIMGEPATLVGHIGAGKVRPIAVTTPKRALSFPELPTVIESGVPGYEVTSWNGMLAPAGTSPDVVRRLNGEYNRIVSDGEMVKRMIANGYEPVGGTPERFGAHIRAEIAKWGPVVKRANIKVD